MSTELESASADALEQARAAFDRHKWDEARGAFANVDPDLLSGADLEKAADAEWWAGHPDEAYDTLDRAHLRHLRAGDRGRAGYVAVLLAYHSARSNKISVASGWLSKAEGILEDEPESAFHAWLALMKAGLAMFGGIGDRAMIMENLESAIELADRHDEPSARALAKSFKGFGLVNHGMWKEGISLVDEAVSSALSGEVDDRGACDVYCNTIATCTTLADYRRAGEWTDEAERWMKRKSLAGYPGICKVHRAQVKRARGDYAGAMQQAMAAREELARYRMVDGVSFAYYEIGMIKLCKGDLDAAEEAFLKSYEHGWHAQPGLALMMLARGEVEEAARSIEPLARVKSGEDHGVQLHRVDLLAAYVTIALANDDLEAAQSAVEQLEEIAGRFEQDTLTARARARRGALHLARGENDQAEGALEEAWRTFHHLDIPLEAAQARVLLAEARAAKGDGMTARMDLNAARSTFKRLGAAQELSLLSGSEEEAPIDAGHRIAKALMFTDIANSTDLAGALGDEAWDDLLRWHDQAVRSEFTTHGGQEVKDTGDGFFVVFDRPGDAIEAAVAIQRRLARHRKEHGFAPSVRIGLHQSEATFEGGDYSGHGVHIASRLEGVAESDQIVASTDLTEEADVIRYPIGDVREADLKGVAEPVEYRVVDWR